MLLRSIRFAVVFMALTGLLYPLATTGLAQVLFPHQANGSIVKVGDRAIGSDLVCQLFTRDEFFHGRVSSITYDASATGSPNLAPSDAALVERVKADLERWRKENPGQPVPEDLLTNSGSGIDPHITPESALIQVPRVARATGLPEEQLRRLVGQHSEKRFLGLFGEPRVNVLKLNLALQAIER